ncbi:MAG: NAD(P)/FAD-dependent oxidoreductase [Clostridium sp.]|uniref:NAD(P)/FAD-dependent oxidoreductase n=1 Tax=Clostridium sp. TaxID=1506 RepID=UPI0029130CF8|nr:NAD(P)/FAD-dependent oxidoreductase [Clostridium sp.]MDU7337457.1 NAD(P)/FAD-dependent oxidoreductase [Clostridium sp.]
MKKTLTQTNKADLVVIGGGAAGLMAAGTAAELGLNVILIEKNTRLGRKLGITGKGRCNLTNNCSVQDVIAAVPTNPRFLYGAVSRFTSQDTMEFFEKLGVPLKMERGQRVFPQSDRAADVIEAFTHYLQQNHVKIIHGEARKLLIEEDGVYGVQLRDATVISAKKVIVACGGASYPGTGSTGDGYHLARQAGHSIVPLRPSLVPLVEQGGDCVQMQGLALKNAAVRVYEKNKLIYEDFGELLFTHFGLSGPVVLSASSHMRKMATGVYRIEIDLKPALSLEKLDARLQRDLEENSNKDFINSLGALLPRKMIPVLVEHSGISPETKCNAITREQRRSFAALLKAFIINIKGFRPIDEAIITSGGVNVKEINPKTMESKLLPGLYFAGEVLDVDAYTGGFNLQIAFATGRLAAQAVKEEVE